VGRCGAPTIAMPGARVRAARLGLWSLCVRVFVRASADAYGCAGSYGARWNRVLRTGGEDERDEPPEPAEQLDRT
jgi:hypothetical protein